MLKLNLNPVLKARGINKPYAFLVKIGISQHVATNMANNLPQSIRLKHIEKLCYHLNCSPNDLFVWMPDDKMQVSDNHSLQKLRNTGLEEELKIFSELNFDKLKQVAQKIKEQSE